MSWLPVRVFLRKSSNFRLKSTTRFFSIGPDNIVSSGLQDITIPDCDIPTIVLEHLHKWEKHTATECALTGRQYSYKDLAGKSNNLNKSLRKLLKLNKGDVIALLLPNVPEFPIVTLGALKAGLILTTINPIYTSEEIGRQLIDSSTKAIVTLNELTPVVHKALNLLQKKLPVITIKNQQGQSTSEGCIDFAQLTDSKCDIPYVTNVGSDIAFIPYSSGTTGLPKGVLLSHKNIVSNLLQLTHPEIRLCNETTETHQDVTPVVLPQFHIYGFTVNCMNLIQLGAKCVTFPKFTPELYIQVLAKHKPSVLYLAPPLAIFLGNHPSVTTEHLRSVETIMSGAAPLGALDEEKLRKKAQKPINILQGYGMTETSPLALCVRKSMKNASGTVGKPPANTQVKIVSIDDPSGAALGPNQKGELLVKGPQVMQGYHNRPEETEKTFINNWLRTGDMMYFNEQGYLIVTDRLKELIKVKGFQVAPAELEEVIRDFPNVSDAAVIGIPHAKDGEVPRGYVVPKPNSTINLEELHKFINAKVASYKRLKGGISIVQQIPKNAAGKIMRRQLKEEFLSNTKH